MHLVFRSLKIVLIFCFSCENTFAGGFEEAQVGLLQRRQSLTGLVFRIHSRKQSKIDKHELLGMIKSREFVEAEKLICLEPADFEETLAIRFEPRLANPYLTKWVCKSRDVDEEVPLLRERWMLVEDTARMLTSFRGNSKSISPAKGNSPNIHFKAQNRIVSRDFLAITATDLNFFLHVLTLDLKHMTIFQDPLGELANGIEYPIHRDGSVVIDGRECHVFKGQRDAGTIKVQFQLACLPSPHFMVVSAEIRVNSVLDQKISVSKVGEIDSIVYPAEGSFETFLPMSGRLLTKYEFKIDKVAKLSANELTGWWPEPSEGTYQLNLLTNKGVQVPFRESTLSDLYRFDIDSKSAKPGRVVLVSLLFVISIGVCLWGWKWLRR